MHSDTNTPFVLHMLHTNLKTKQMHAYYSDTEIIAYLLANNKITKSHSKKLPYKYNILPLINNNYIIIILHNNKTTTLPESNVHG